MVESDPPGRPCAWNARRCRSRARSSQLKARRPCCTACRAPPGRDRLRRALPAGRETATTRRQHADEGLVGLVQDIVRVPPGSGARHRSRAGRERRRRWCSRTCPPPSRRSKQLEERAGGPRHHLPPGRNSKSSPPLNLLREKRRHRRGGAAGALRQPLPAAGRCAARARHRGRERVAGAAGAAPWPRLRRHDGWRSACGPTAALAGGVAQSGTASRSAASESWRSCPKRSPSAEARKRRPRRSRCEREQEGSPARREALEALEPQLARAARGALAATKRAAGEPRPSDPPAQRGRTLCAQSCARGDDDTDWPAAAAPSDVRDANAARQRRDRSTSRWQRDREAIGQLAPRRSATYRRASPRRPPPTPTSRAKRGPWRASWRCSARA